MAATMINLEALQLNGPKILEDRIQLYHLIWSVYGNLKQAEAMVIRGLINFDAPNNDLNESNTLFKKFIDI